MEDIQIGIGELWNNVPKLICVDSIPYIKGSILPELTVKRVEFATLCVKIVSDVG